MTFVRVVEVTVVQVIGVAGVTHGGVSTARACAWSEWVGAEQVVIE